MGGPFFRKIAFLVVSRFVLLIGLRLARYPFANFVRNSSTPQSALRGLNRQPHICSGQAWVQL